VLKRFAVFLLALLAAAAAHAQVASGSFPFVHSYDLDSATFTYPLLELSRPGTANIKTTGSSATIDAASGAPFAGIGVGSVLTVRTSTALSTPDFRTIIAKASDVQVTVEAAVDWSGAGAAGFRFDYQVLTDGTGLGAGWFGVSKYGPKSLYFAIAQQNTTTGITIQIECKQAGGLPVKVWPETTGTAQCDADGVFTTAGIGDRCLIQLPDGPLSSCRLGLKLTSTDDGGDTGANRESVFASFSGVPR